MHGLDELVRAGCPRSPPRSQPPPLAQPTQHDEMGEVLTAQHPQYWRRRRAVWWRVTVDVPVRHSRGRTRARTQRASRAIELRATPASRSASGARSRTTTSGWFPSSSELRTRVEQSKPDLASVCFVNRGPTRSAKSARVSRTSSISAPPAPSERSCSVSPSPTWADRLTQGQSRRLPRSSAPTTHAHGAGARRPPPPDAVRVADARLDDQGQSARWPANAASATLLSSVSSRSRAPPLSPSVADAARAR